MTAAAVVIPQAMAYATIAGLPVEVGLHTALVIFVGQLSKILEVPVAQEGTAAR